MNSKIKKFFDTDIDKVYIILGDYCNMKCKYCFHNNDVMPYVDEKINEDIFPFIETIASRQKSPLNVRFFGGEPLIYFNKMKYIIEKLAHVSNIFFTTITNGKSITQEIVDFFNKYNVMVSVSWDGHKASKEFRGFDCFDTNKNLLLQLKKIEVLATFVNFLKIDDFLSDLENINNEYFNIHGEIIGFTWAPIDDVGSQKEYLSKAMFNDLYKKSEEVCNRVKDAIRKKHKTPFDLVLIYALYSDLCTIESRDFGTSAERLIAEGSDNPKIYSIDLNGDFYQFHRYPKSSSKSKKLGNIYMHYYAYMQSYLSQNKFAEQCARVGCYNCDINHFCKGPGPHVCEESEKKCCRIRYALYKPIVNLIEWLQHGGIDLHDL